MTAQEKAIDAVNRATEYLCSCGIRVPPYALTTDWSAHLGGSFVASFAGSHQLNIGRFPMAFFRNWFAIHELGHLLWAEHKPLRWKKFRREFGAIRPRNYYELHRTHSWRTTLAHRLSQFPGPHRPAGEPSWYGKVAGGEERFCELIALMYANGDFTSPAPPDLAEVWGTCWDHGLARMT